MHLFPCVWGSAPSVARASARGLTALRTIPWLTCPRGWWWNGQYEGSYRENKFHGRGVYTTRRGRYEGYFEHGLKHGKGVMEWHAGGLYMGTWDCGLMHGKGKYTSIDGKQYEVRSAVIKKLKY